MQRSKGKNFICLVTSLCDGGGSSFVAMNLAAAVALDKTKTSLLVDCNLYDPSVDRLLGVEADYGLTDFLDEPQLQVQDIIYASGVPRMRLIPVGSNRERGAEHFSSQRMGQFVDGIKARYADRFVFVDAPPIASSAEAKILAGLCDMVVLVVPYGKVSEQQMNQGISMVAEDKLAGVVFNN
jgi:Mrp family chromosome partitioning ATPase